MDADGFEVQRRRRGYSSREPTRDRGSAEFLSQVGTYEGTPEDFSRAHTRRYGREEGLGPDGSHDHLSYDFPRGSDRQRQYDRYNVSTRGMNMARHIYSNGLTAAQAEFEDMDEDERDFYRENSAGLTPSQHERLDPPAKEYRDKAYSNATNREAFLRAHPHGYHTMDEQNRHHNCARRAYTEYEYARDQQKQHEENRSYSNADRRRDQYGRPMSNRR